MKDLPLNQILCGDCVEVLKDFPDNSIDLVVTDPPYGLKFMGKDWDKALPSKEAFEQVIRVLKPGALAFVMSSPRQDLLWRMLALLEGVGFELTQSYIDWIYKTGFPKAYDVSKGIDKRWKKIKEYDELAEYLKKTRISLGKSQKDLAKFFPSATGGLTGCVWNWENGSNVPTPEQYIILKRELQLSDRFDYLIKKETRRWLEAERKIITERTMIQGGGHSYELRVGERREVEANITAPSLDEAKKWEGWKSQTGLKPAHEPILMVNKPFSEPTIVDNVLKWGTGAINVDVCRIPIIQGDEPLSHRGVQKNKNVYGNFAESYDHEGREYSSQGRFPANLLVSDRALDTGKLSKSGTLESHHEINSSKTRNIYGEYQDQLPEEHTTYGDIGDQSRYFNLDAWAKHHGFLDVPKPDNKERDYGLKGKKSIPTSKLNLSDGKNPVRLDGAISLPRRNVHPTVKPIKLMAYLIELGCPPNGVVLDPFVGSGTTCIAAKKLVRKYVGIEINPEYVALAEARIRAYPVPFDWFKEDSVGVPPRGGKNE